MTTYDDFDEYDEYAARVDPTWHEQWVDPRRKANHRAKKSRTALMEEISEGRDLAESVTMSYRAARFEEGWLLDSLRPFYEQSLILDVVARVKGGKEASVYRCRAHPSTGHEWLAAKVYRPRMLRNLRNDATYREGRATLTDEGKLVKKNDDRVMRALGKKTAFGQQVAHTSWLMYEYTTLQRLHATGAAVPAPIGTGENALLMGYIGDEHRAAPTLNEVGLSDEEAPRLFAELLRTIELLLSMGWVHGDLSAYNVLYWQGRVTLIDFPQVSDIHTNSAAERLFRRDVQRVCDYFQVQGVPSDADALARELWEHVATPMLVPRVPAIPADGT